MKRTVFAWTAVALSSTIFAVAQQNAPMPQAPLSQAAPASQTAPPAPKPATIKFPPADPVNFTAASPTTEEVNSFLKALWGYDENRIWSVAAILATPAPGVSKVVVYVADKNQTTRQSQTVFFTTPDGKHVIADNVTSFGAKPFADTRSILQARADGPAIGPKSNELLLVEFGDLQCSRCRDAQTVMENLSQDFPKARIVFEDFPLPELHPYASRAAAVGACVRKAKGDAAFFAYAQAVYGSQDGLTKDRVDVTLNTAAAKAGADPTTVATCADTQAAKDAVNASIKLGRDIGISETPTLSVNGRLLPLTSISYDVLKRILVYQANQDGVPMVLQPSLRTLR